MRQVDLTSSCYVGGSIDKKARDRWVNALPSPEEAKKLVREYDDVRLGMTVKACTQMKRNVKNAVNKVDSQGNRGTWTRHLTDLRNYLYEQRKLIFEFAEIASEEADRRENEPAVVEVPHADPCVQRLEETEDEQQQQERDPMGELMDMFGPTSLNDILALAKQGLEGKATDDLKKQLEEMGKDVRSKDKELKKMRSSLDHKNKQLEDKSAEIKELRQKVEKQGKAIKTFRAAQTAFADLEDI